MRSLDATAGTGSPGFGLRSRLDTHSNDKRSTAANDAAVTATLFHEGDRVLGACWVCAGTAGSATAGSGAGAVKWVLFDPLDDAIRKIGRQRETRQLPKAGLNTLKI